MALRTIITLPDPRLRAVCEPVPEVDSAVRALMTDMLETMYEAPGIGLAAAQIAIPKRVIVIDVAKRKDETASADPMVFAQSGNYLGLGGNLFLRGRLPFHS